MQQQILEMLLKEEEVGWKTILVDLVQKEQMNPWDIDVSLIAQKYVEVIKSMQEHDLKISGKVLLAAAILLKMKSTHLVDKDISHFDALLNPEETIMEEDNLSPEGQGRREKQHFPLIPRNPQPRNRKVSIQDLVNALQQAMATKKRMLEKIRPVNFQLPDKRVDIVEVIHDLFHKIMYYSAKDNTDKVTFAKLLPPRAGKHEKVYTFLPLLHLEHEQKIEMEQEKPFDEILVSIADKKKSIKD